MLLTHRDQAGIRMKILKTRQVSVVFEVSIDIYEPLGWTTSVKPVGCFFATASWYSMS